MKPYGPARSCRPGLARFLQSDGHVMGYAFQKTRDTEGRWQFDLHGIRLVVDGFEERDGRHWLQTPERAVAFFTLDGNFYGMSNNMVAHPTAEALYEDLRKQFIHFDAGATAAPALQAV